MTDAAPDTADPVAKIGDLAASAGVRRVHVLAWRDLEDVEAGGSEVHIAEVAKLWAAAGLDITMRTSWAQGQPTEAVRDGYKVIRRAGRHMVFPRAAMAEILRRTGPRDVLVEIWNGMPFLSPVWNRGPRVILLHHVHAEMWNMVLGDTLGRIGAFFERRIAPPLYRTSAIATLSHSSKRELVEELGFREDRVFVVHPGIDPRFSPGGERAPEPLVVACGRLAPVKRYDLLVRAAHHARRQVPGLQLHIVGEGYERPLIESVVDELDAGDGSPPGRLSDSEPSTLSAGVDRVPGVGPRGLGHDATGPPPAAPGGRHLARRARRRRDGESGLLADGDPVSLGDAMARVLGDPDLRSRLSRGALEWAGQLTWSNTATQLMRVVADEVSRRRARR